MTFARDVAQAFTTGSNAGGYKVTAIDFHVEVGDTAPTFEVLIFEGQMERTNRAKPQTTWAH